MLSLLILRMMDYQLVLSSEHLSITVSDWIIYGTHREDSSDMDHLRLSSAYVKQSEKPWQTCLYYLTSCTGNMLYLEARLITKVLIGI